VDGSAESSSEVGWARSNVAQVLVMSEFGNLLNCLSSSAESVENCMDICSRLHRDDTKLVLFIDPNKECLGIVVEDTSAGWPVAVQSASLKESVSFFEKEVVSDKLFLVFF